MIFFDIDTQRDFMDADGALYVKGAEAIRGNIERLLRVAGERGILTISSGGDARCRAHLSRSPASAADRNPG